MYAADDAKTPRRQDPGHLGWKLKFRADDKWLSAQGPRHGDHDVGHGRHGSKSQNSKSVPRV